MSTARHRKKRRKTKKRGPLGLAAMLVVVLGALTGLSVVGYVVGVAASAPPLGKPVDKGSSSEVFAADGTRLGYVQSDEIRTPIPWARIPRELKDATVAIEDERYYRHKGVDYSSIIRAAVKNMRSGKTVQGGSTITQQLVRNLYIANPRRDYKRKIREAKLASELEQQHSKKWILDQYLNTAPYGTYNGQSAIGVEAAAQTVFAKSASKLTLAESALLAGLPQAPSRFNPFQNAAGAVARRNEVLAKMIELGHVSRARGEAAIASPLKVHRGNRYTRIREPFFFDYVKQQMIERYGINVVRRGGLKIFTTIDPDLQRAGREAINGQLNQAGDPSSAIVAIDPRTGYIKAMASSASYGDSQFNLAAQGLRQPGSAFKTMVLVAALRQGIAPASVNYASKPLKLNDPIYGKIDVKTYDSSYGGVMNLVRATLRSDNTVYMQLILDVGPRKVRETARLLGITAKLNAYPAEGLGGLERGVSPLEMANAYATLAAGGIRSRPHAIARVQFPDGSVQRIGRPARKRVVSEGVAYEATKILKQNVVGGTGTRAQIGCPAAGKTGTTDSFKDAWFAGYTPRLSAAVWVGYPDSGIEMRNVHGISVAGGTFPAQIWGAFMKRAKGRHCEDFAEPSVPFEARPFIGKYTTTAQPDDDGDNDKDDKDKDKKKGDKKTGGQGEGRNPKPKSPAKPETPPPANEETGATPVG